MSKKKRQYRSAGSSKKRRKQSRNSTSLVIPIVVGLVVVAIIVGAIISIENRRSQAAAGSEGGLSSAATANPLATRSIPYPDVPRISLQETQDRLASGQAVLIDVRSKESYDRAHAAGALSVPEAEIHTRVEELPRDIDLVLY
jgi:hypothetical protein